MPKEITHWILAEKALQQLPERYRMKRVIKRHRQLYLIGAVLPDTPYTYLFGPGKKKVQDAAIAMHDSPGDSFQPVHAVLSHYRGKGVPEYVWALLAGVAAHIMADATFHPMVCYFAGNNYARKKTEMRHSMIETALDLHHLHSMPLINRELFACSILKRSISMRSLSEFLAVFLGMSPERDRWLMHRLFLYHALLQWSFGKKWIRSLLQMLNRMPGMDLERKLTHYYPQYRSTPLSFFSEKIDFRHPVDGMRRQKTANDLEADFLDRMGVLDAFEECLDSGGKESLELGEQPNLLTGMVGVASDRMQFFNTDCDLALLLDLHGRLFHLPQKQAAQ